MYFNILIPRLIYECSQYTHLTHTAILESVLYTLRKLYESWSCYVNAIASVFSFKLLLFQ